MQQNVKQVNYREVINFALSSGRNPDDVNKLIICMLLFKVIVIRFMSHT